jgi:hypothetical protein
MLRPKGVETPSDDRLTECKIHHRAGGTVVSARINPRDYDRNELREMARKRDDAVRWVSHIDPQQWLRLASVRSFLIMTTLLLESGGVIERFPQC